MYSGCAGLCQGWKWRESTKTSLKKINESISKTCLGDALISWSNFVPSKQSSWIMPSFFSMVSHIDELHCTLYKQSNQCGFESPLLNFIKSVKEKPNLKDYFKHFTNFDKSSYRYQTIFFAFRLNEWSLHRAKGLIGSLNLKQERKNH